MLVATPGQTSYSTLHNNTTNGGGSSSTSAATSSTKKPTLNSANAINSGTAKSLKNNNHAASIVTTKNSLNSNTHSTTYNYNTNSKIDIIVNNKISNQNKTASSREYFSSTKSSETAHSLRSENSTNTTNTTSNKQHSFIQTLKDSVQKVLISTTGATGNSNSIVVNKHSADNKLKNSNNSTSSIYNVTSSSCTSLNANKVSTTASSITSNHSGTAVPSSSSMAVVRSKHLSCSLSKLHTVAPTVIHRYPEERENASSTDSLEKEMCHFKPIRIVPKTPWKSGSKSRGNCLRFPKANLATKKAEFVLKSNCDVNNRKKNQQKNRAKIDKISMDETDDDNEQENKEILGIYKPKPSLICLSTSITTPNHQSAFVCLVAQMKNLVNMQSKRQLVLAKSASPLLEEESDESVIEIYKRKTQKPTRKQHKEEEKLEVFPKIRSARLSSNAVKNKSVSNTAAYENGAKEIVKQKNDNLNISKGSATAIKAKSRRKSGREKSSTFNTVALSATKTKEKLQNNKTTPAIVSNKSKTVASARKSKATEDLHDLLQQQLLKTSQSTPAASIKSLSLSSRKSSRLSSIKTTRTTNQLLKFPTNQVPQETIIKSSPKTHKNSRSVACFSPPLTRSRLKRLMEQGKIDTSAATGIKKRKI